MTAALLLLVAALQQPNLIIEVRLDGTGQATTVEAELLSDSTLLLPSADLGAFLGTPSEPAPWLALGTLRTRFPAVSWQWIPRALLLLVVDPNQVLPVSRALAASLERQARGAAPYAVITSGPFAALAADNVGKTLVDLGYSFRGRAAITVRRSSTLGTTYTISLAPVPQLFATYAGGDGPSGTASARLAAGPAWLQASYVRGQALMVDGLLQLGIVSLFGAPQRHAYMITLRGPIAVQWGRLGSTSVARVSVGPIPPSPFLVPQVP